MAEFLILIFFLIIVLPFIILFLIASFLKLMFSKFSSLEDEEERHPLYMKKIFSRDEEKLYNCLYKIINEREDYELLAKVRWEDLMGVKSGSGATRSECSRYRGWLRSRHVDFCIIDRKTMYPKIIIELNDPSHNQLKVMKRDDRLKKFCTSVKLPLMFIKSRNKYDCEKIREELNKCINTEKSIVCYC